MIAKHHRRYVFVVVEGGGFRRRREASWVVAFVVGRRDPDFGGSFLCCGALLSSCIAGCLSSSVGSSVGGGDMVVGRAFPFVGEWLLSSWRSGFRCRLRGAEKRYQGFSQASATPSKLYPNHSRLGFCKGFGATLVDLLGAPHPSLLVLC